jgi:hypothetical protein
MFIGAADRRRARDLAVALQDVDRRHAGAPRHVGQTLRHGRPRRHEADGVRRRDPAHAVSVVVHHVDLLPLAVLGDEGDPRQRDARLSGQLLDDVVGDLVRHPSRELRASPVAAIEQRRLGGGVHQVRAQIDAAGVDLERSQEDRRGAQARPFWDSSFSGEDPASG